MGDYVIKNLIEATPHAAEKMQSWITKNKAADVYIVLADREKDKESLAITQQLRDWGLSVERPFKAGNVGKQFKKAASSGALYSLVIGSEYPEISLKNMETREEVMVQVSQLKQAHFA